MTIATSLLYNRLMTNFPRIIYLVSVWVMGLSLAIIVAADIMYPVSDTFLRTFGYIAIIAAVGALYGLAKGRRGR